MEALKVYEFHGLTLKPIGDNAVGDCPFCDKASHFYVNTKTGQFNCRRCQASGNAVSFLEQLYDSATGSVKSVPLQRLASERNLDLSEMLWWGLKVSRLDGAFLLPMYNIKGKFANLARIVKAQGKWSVYGSPGCKMHPFGTKHLQGQQKTLWVCEGPWDAMALTYALRHVRTDGKRWIAHSGDKIAIRSQGVIAIPGAGSFSAEWLHYFANRDVRTLLDSDHPKKSAGTSKAVQPGWDGTQRIIKLFDEHQPISSKISFLGWGTKGFDPALKDGYDIRDAASERSPQQLMSFICGRLKTPKISSPEKNGEAAPPIAPLECTTFKELCQHFQQHLYFPDSVRTCLIVGIATVISTKLAGEQLWFRIIGPPGSGKTTLAECLSAARELCFPKSILTGFHSGKRADRTNGRREPSLVPQMNGKCVIIKDADTLFSSGAKDKILSELRDIYDGSSRAHYRTGKQQDFESLRTTFLLCGTDAMRMYNRSFLGERFLDCDILGESSTNEYLDAAMSTGFEAVYGSLAGREATGSHSQVLKQATYGFLLALSQRITEQKVSIPSASPGVQARIKAMAQLLAYTRARVEREKEEMCYRPRAELATRLIKQFAKLAVCVALVLDKTTIDNEVVNIVGQVLHYTSHGYPYEIIEYLYTHPAGKASLSIHNALGLSQTTISHLCDDMQELGILERRDESNRSGVGGRNLHLWFLSREVREVFKLSKGK